MLIIIIITYDCKQLDTWELSVFFNKRKTEVVIFGTDASFKIYVENYGLTRVSDFKYLAVVLDELNLP